MKALADTSSLIHPAKLPEFWDLMHRTFELILIPEAVYKEILRGKDFGSSDVPVIEIAIAKGWIEIRKQSARRTSSFENLGEGSHYIDGKGKSGLVTYG
ncbi:MAG: hypothetical protein ACYC7D_13515 [Nitrososphaerales archaeon]